MFEGRGTYPGARAFLRAAAVVAVGTIALMGCAGQDEKAAASSVQAEATATAPARTGAVFDGNLPVDRSTSPGKPSLSPTATAIPSPTAAVAPSPTAVTTPSATTGPPTPTPEVATPDSAVGASAEPAGAAPGGSLGQFVQPPAPAAPAAATSKGAAAKAKVIALDPGHGGAEPGASAAGLAEKDLNLKIGLKLAALLRDEGYDVVMTRDTDRSVSPQYRGAGYSGGLGADLQARVDIANAAGADLFLSIHNNGSNDTSQAGTEVWYSKQRTFGDRNLALATLLQANIVARIRQLGYPVFDRGIKDDSTFRIFRGRAYNIYVLGPGEGPRAHVPSLMPGALGESLIVSNPGDAAMLRKDSTLDAIATGYRDAVIQYFRQFPS